MSISEPNKTSINTSSSPVLGKLPSIDTSFDKAPGGSNHTTPSATPTVKRPTPLVGRWGDYAWDNFCAAETDENGNPMDPSAVPASPGPGAVGTPLNGKPAVHAFDGGDEEDAAIRSPSKKADHTTSPADITPREGSANAPATKPPAGPGPVLLGVNRMSPSKVASKAAPAPKVPQYLTDPARESKTPDFSAPNSYNNRVPRGPLVAGGGASDEIHQPQALPSVTATGSLAGPGLSSPPSTTFEAERTGSSIGVVLSDTSAANSRQQSTMPLGGTTGAGGNNRTQHAPYFQQNNNNSSASSPTAAANNTNGQSAPSDGGDGSPSRSLGGTGNQQHFGSLGATQGNGSPHGTSLSASMVSQSALLPPGMDKALSGGGGGSLSSTYNNPNSPPSGGGNSNHHQQQSQPQPQPQPQPQQGGGGEWNGGPRGHHYPQGGSYQSQGGSTPDHYQQQSNYNQQQQQQGGFQQQQGGGGGAGYPQHGINNNGPQWTPQHQHQHQQQQFSGMPGMGMVGAAMPPAAHFGAQGPPLPGHGASMFGMPPFANAHQLPPGFVQPPMPPGMFNPLFNVGANSAGVFQPHQQHSGRTTPGQVSYYNQSGSNSGTPTPVHSAPAVANGGAGASGGPYQPVQITRFPPPPPPSAKCLQILEGDGSDPAIGRTIAKRWHKKQLTSQMAHVQIPPCPEPDFTLHSLENWLRVSGEWWKLNYADMKTSALHGPPSQGPAPQPGSATRRRKEGGGASSQPGSRNNRTAGDSGGGGGSNPPSQPSSQPGSRNNRMPKVTVEPLATSNPPSLPPSQPGSRNNRMPVSGGGGGSQPGSRNNRQPLRDQHTPHNFVMEDFRTTSSTPPPPSVDEGSASMIVVSGSTTPVPSPTVTVTVG